MNRDARQLPPGEKKVEITATKVIGKRPAYPGDPNSPQMDIVEHIIPSNYNAATTLRASIVQGPNAQDFKLESGKKSGP
jgi:hypothetical protein